MFNPLNNSLELHEITDLFESTIVPFTYSAIGNDKFIQLFINTTGVIASSSWVKLGVVKEKYRPKLYSVFYGTIRSGATFAFCNIKTNGECFAFQPSGNNSAVDCYGTYLY